MPTAVAICYTSTQPITLPSPVLQDKVFSLSDLDPPQVVQLYARGVNTGDPGDTPASYAWTLLDAPEGNAATFSDPNSASPTFGPVAQLWGNYRFRCVVTMSSGLVSESRALYAPNSAFVHIRVESNSLGLQKPAKWERDWHPLIRKAIGALESIRSLIYAQTIAQHGDVSVATGPTLDQLVSGGYATVGGSPLHKHHGTDIGLASDASLGVAKTEIEPVDAYNPTAINCERLVFTALVPGTLSDGQTMAAFYLQDALEIASVAVAIEESGVADSITANSMQLRVADIAGYEAGTMDDLGSPFGGAPAAGNGRKVYSLSGIDTPLGAGTMLTLSCEQAVDGTRPRTSTVTITAYRKV